MNHGIRVAIVALLAGVAPGLASAQIVRGVVTERGSGTPLAGALVTLVMESSDSARFQAVTSRTGEFAVRALAPGAYLLTVRRIGVRAYVSDPLRLGAGETTVHDVELDPFGTLPVVTIVDRTVCTRGRDGPRVGALWREAETALSVILVSSRDSTLGRRLVRFTRRLAPFTDSIVDEQVHAFDERDGVMTNFLSLGGDSLSRAGYWTEADGGLLFYAPDASSLLSASFVRDHCFSLVEQRADRRGLVGLAFAPVRTRTTPDIRGTLWLDNRTFELRFVEFDWTQLPREIDHERVGGEVHFMQLPSGAWIVKHWTLTMPRPREIEFRSVGGPRRRTLTSDGLAQEGGLIVVQGLDGSDHPGTVTGTITRAGKPLAGTRVRLVGTPLETEVDDQGRFRFDRVPPGPHALVADHREYEAFGIRAAEATFFLQEGGERHVSLLARTERELADALCPLDRDSRLPTLRVSLVDEQTRRPLTRARLRLRWLEVRNDVVGGIMTPVPQEMSVDATTDDSGHAMFCALPSEKRLTLGYPVDDGLSPLHTFTLRLHQNHVATVRAAPPE